MAARRTALIPLVLFCLAGCSSPTAPAPPPPVDNIEFVQPPNVTVDKVTTPTVKVDYPLPTATGGVPPVTITCSPPPGSSFPIGTTVVTCVAADEVRRAECRFSVIVIAAAPVIQATKFLAFGDSITAGEVQTNPSSLEVQPDNSYPTVLRKKLAGTYTGQTINMVNAGLPGERAEVGAHRIGGVLDANHPEVLLLLQGVLDLGIGPSGIPIMSSALRSDILQARSKGVQHIFLSTLLPQKEPYTAYGYPRNNYAMPYIEDANAEIEALAAREDVYLVDAYGAMVGHVDTLIGGDGLHPTKEGYEALADTFFTAIRSTLEKPPEPGGTRASRLLARPYIQIRP